MKDFSKFSADEIVKKYNRLILTIIIMQILCILVAVVACCAVFVSTYMQSNMTSFLLIVFFIALLICALLGLVPPVKLIFINLVLYANLDPDKYIAIWTSIKYKRYLRGFRFSPEIQLAYGFYYAGRVQEALQQLSSVDANSNVATQLLWYYMILFQCQTSLGNYVYIDELLLMLQTIKDKSRMKVVKNQADSVMDFVNREILFHNGQYTAYEQKLLELLREKNTPMSNTLINYSLAKLYFETGDYEKSKYRCQYVIENGNKLFVVQKAKEMMDKIS